MKFETVIGLEVHIQLKTNTKMFCACPLKEAGQPNENICPICLGHPGTLPVPNKAAVEAGVRMATAMGCTINTKSKFDRKNYFYPDLPKGYQISQFDLPVGEHGKIVIDDQEKIGRGEIEIGITRLHLEEDAAKNIHSEDGSESYVDYNRGGTPLAEMVSEPDLRSPAEAKAYLQEVRLIARTLGISDADMEKGHLRCDANISLRQLDDDGNIIGEFFNPKTEVKNLNSFKMVERALAYEIKRQTKLWEEGKRPTQTTTRGWDDNKGKTVVQRVKEDASEYRFFPDPDLPKIDLTEIAKVAKESLPELPAQKRLRFEDEYGISASEAKLLVEHIELANFAEEVFSELTAENIVVRDVAKTVESWLINKWGGILNSQKKTVNDRSVTAENFAELMKLILNDDVTAKNALHILEVMTQAGKDPSQIMEDEGLGRMGDESEIANIVKDVIKNSPNEVERYLAGEEKILKFLMGMVMKRTEGRADPGLLGNIMKVELEEKRK